MGVPENCRLDSHGKAEAEEKVLIIDFHGATWEDFTKAYARDLANFSEEELEALRDYCNYHRDNFVPEMARETAERIVKMRNDVRVDVFSVVDLPRGIVDLNRVNFEGERPAFPPHIAEKFDHLRERFRAFHQAAQIYLADIVRNYDAVFDLHSMNGWDLNERGKKAEEKAMRVPDFAERLRRLVEIGTRDDSMGEIRMNNLFLSGANGVEVGCRRFHDLLLSALVGRGFWVKTDEPYNFFELLFSTFVAQLCKEAGIPHGMIDVDVKSVGRLPHSKRRRGDAALIHVDAKPFHGRILKISEAFAQAIIETLQSAKHV